VAAVAAGAVDGARACTCGRTCPAVSIQAGPGQAVAGLVAAVELGWVGGAHHQGCPTPPRCPAGCGAAFAAHDGQQGHALDRGGLKHPHQIQEAAENVRQVGVDDSQSSSITRCCAQGTGSFPRSRRRTTTAT
jgi:hypothetical protein